jgi:peptidase E
VSRALGLLGPQRLTPTLIDAVRALGVEGPLATVTAGWQERENDAQELVEHLKGRALPLELHKLAEDAFAKDPELARAHHARQDAFRRLQDLYRYRLDSTKRLVRELMRRTAPQNGHGRGNDHGNGRAAAALVAEREDAIDAVRRLDARHLERLDAIHAEWDAEVRPWERDAVARHRAAIAKTLADSAGLAIAGGHVAVLVNRLRLFGVLELLGDKPVVAWSGGAMVASDRIVLFHDHPPQGAGNAEVMDRGLGLAPGLVLLPHARRRLALDDPGRVTIFARRFEPATCLALDDGAHLLFHDDRWHAGEGVRRLTADGTLTALPTEAA